MFSDCLSSCPSVCPSVIGFRYSDNLRMAEGIQVKLGTSMYNDANMN